MITCVVEPGVGSNFELFIRDFWVSSNVMAGYERPVIESVSPSRLSVSGSNVTIVGSNFGGMWCEGISEVRMAVSRLISSGVRDRPGFIVSSSGSGFNSSGRWTALESVPCTVLRCVSSC